jgi:ABC-2 type transport system permease protein
VNRLIAASTAYGRIYQAGLQGSLVYRWNYLLRCLFNLVPLVASLIFWEAVCESNGTVADYTLSSILLYYILLLILDAATSPVDDDFRIASEIRDGQLNHLLLKPIPYAAYRFTLFSASRTAYLAAVLIPTLAILALLGSVWPVSWDSIHLWHGLPAALGSACLQFSITYCTSLLAFWLLDISSVVFIVFSLEYLTGGHVFPLDLLPQPLYKTALCLPFAYEYYFPVSAFMGRLSHTDWALGLLMQAAWTAFFFLLAALVWRRGLRAYGAVGG